MVKFTLNHHLTIAVWQVLAAKQVKGRAEIRKHSRAFAALKKGACVHTPEIPEEKDETGKVTKPVTPEVYDRKGGEVQMGPEIFKYLTTCVNEHIDTQGVRGEWVHHFDELCGILDAAQKAHDEEEEKKEKAA